jgi:two-component system, LytTR family, response regulator
MSDTIRCVVIDDEPLAVRLLVDYVRKTPGCEVVFQTTSILQATKYLEENKADLVLLDIQMPELTGMQWLKQMQGMIKVILTTAYSEYALEGYQYDVIDYLLKPITYERFFMAIQKFKRTLPVTETINKETESIFLKTEHRIQQVMLNALLYIEARRDYLAFHTTEGKILTLESLRHMESILPANRFIRIHKSYIINLAKIDFIEKSRVVIQGTYLPVGESFKENLTRIIGI